MKGIKDSVTVQRNVGENIRKAREGAKLKRQSFVDALNHSDLRPIEEKRRDGLTIDRLKQWELGNNPVPLEWLPAICETLRIDYGYLFGEYEEHTRAAADIVKETGLTAVALSKLTDKTNIDHDRIIQALNLLLLSTNFLNLLSDMAEYESEYKMLYDLRMAKNKQLHSSAADQPNQFLDDMISKQEMKTKSVEFSARDNFSFVLREITGEINGTRQKLIEFAKKEMERNGYNG